MRRLALVGACVALLAAAAGWYGTVEGAGAIDRQQQGLLAVRTAVGPRLLHPGQAVYDLGGRLQCLAYAVNSNVFALELCFDSQGRLIEAVDRRGVEHISTLRWRPSEAPLRLAPAEVERAVKNVPKENRLYGLVP
jgi:hypothetical protein